MYNKIIRLITKKNNNRENINMNNQQIRILIADDEKAIRDILIKTEEWKALPEYEVFYD